MATHVIPDNGSFLFSARSTNADGSHTTRSLAVIGWAVDDETMQPKPLVFPDLKEGETLVFNSSLNSFVEVE